MKSWSGRMQYYSRSRYLELDKEMSRAFREFESKQAYEKQKKELIKKIITERLEGIDWDGEDDDDGE